MSWKTKYISLSRSYPRDSTGLIGEGVRCGDILIACSEKHHPFVLFRSPKRVPRASLVLEMVTVEYSRECKLHVGGIEKIQGVFNVVSLKSDVPDVVSLFLDLLEEVFGGLEGRISEDSIENTILSISSLFREERGDRFTELGLWGELFVIENSSCPQSAIEAWSQSRNSTFDFETHSFFLEVKTTKKSDRIHTFSYDQLQKKSTKDIWIASLHVRESLKGLSVRDLINSQLRRMTSHEEKIDFLKNCGTKWGYTESHDSPRFELLNPLDGIPIYSSLDVPSAIVPDGAPISRLKFDVNLSCLSNNVVTKRLEYMDFSLYRCPIEQK